MHVKREHMEVQLRRLERKRAQYIKYMESTRPRNQTIMLSAIFTIIIMVTYYLLYDSIGILLGLAFSAFTIFMNIVIRDRHLRRTKGDLDIKIMKLEKRLKEG